MDLFWVVILTCIWCALVALGVFSVIYGRRF